MNEQEAKLALQYLQRIDERMIRIERQMADLIDRIDALGQQFEAVTTKLDRMGLQLERIDRYLRSLGERPH
jgi:uncharacterized coiled-coil protein SlyX